MSASPASDVKATVCCPPAATCPANTREHDTIVTAQKPHRICGLFPTWKQPLPTPERSCQGQPAAPMPDELSIAVDRAQEDAADPDKEEKEKDKEEETTEGGG